MQSRVADLEASRKDSRRLSTALNDRLGDVEKWRGVQDIQVEKVIHRLDVGDEKIEEVIDRLEVSDEKIDNLDSQVLDRQESSSQGLTFFEESLEDLDRGVDDLEEDLAAIYRYGEDRFDGWPER